MVRKAERRDDAVVEAVRRHQLAYVADARRVRFEADVADVGPQRLQLEQGLAEIHADVDKRPWGGEKCLRNYAIEPGFLLPQRRREQAEAAQHRDPDAPPVQAGTLRDVEGPQETAAAESAGDKAGEHGATAEQPGCQAGAIKKRGRCGVPFPYSVFRQTATDECLGSIQNFVALTLTRAASPAIVQEFVGVGP